MTPDQYLRIADLLRRIAEVDVLELADLCEREAKREPVAHLFVGGIYGEELQDWDIDAEQGKCDALNEAAYPKGLRLPLYTRD